MAGAEDWLHRQRAIWEARLDRFEAYVMKLKSTAKKKRPARRLASSSK
jgi:hypothetical protein